MASAWAARRIIAPLVPDPSVATRSLPRPGLLEGVEPLPVSLRIAAAVVEDRLGDALAEPANDGEALIWRAVALRRTGRFQEARRAFRAVGARPEYPRLFERAVVRLRAGGGGFRWATESADHLLARGSWDPLWFVDACAAVQAGLLSRESAALLEEIQRAELQLLLDAGSAG